MISSLRSCSYSKLYGDGVEIQHFRGIKIISHTNKQIILCIKVLTSINFTAWTKSLGENLLQSGAKLELSIIEALFTPRKNRLPKMVFTSKEKV